MIDFANQRSSAVLLLGATFLTPFATSGASAQTATQAAPFQLAMADPADPADPAPAPPPSVDTGLGDIVVTATRSAQSGQRVPISLQALGADKLAERQVKGLSDFAALLPSVSYAGIGPGRNTIYFRGIVPAGGNYASVGFYLDDIPITGTGSPDVHVYDVERVEALSGPQGTLYGAGSLAGTVRIITNKAKTGQFEAGYDVEGNKYGKGAFGGQFQSYVNVPLGETLAVRAMGYYRRDGGYIDNTPNNGKFNDGSSSTLTLGDNNPATSFTLNNASIAKKDYNPIREYGGRVSATWELAPGWDIMPEVTAQRQKAYGYFGYDNKVGDLQVHDYDLTKQDDKWYQAQLAIHGHIGDFDLVWATGYFQRRTKLNNDYTYYTVTYDAFGAGYENYLQFFDKSGCTGAGVTLKCTKLLNPTQYFHGDTHRDKFTQEVRLTTPKEWPFDVTVGGFYQFQKQQNNTYYAIRGLDQIAGYTKSGGGDQVGGLLGVPTTVPNGTMIVGLPTVKQDGFYITETNQVYHDEAIFAEGHYNITNNLKLTGGIRYFWTSYNVIGFAGVMASATSSAAYYVPTKTQGCVLPLPAARLQCLNQNPLAADHKGRYKENGETHKVVLDWQLTPDKMIYANYSTGFRPGGYNRPLRIRTTGITVAAPSFKSETLTNYEIGVKTTWNNVFRFNASAYYETWNNIQYAVVVAGAQGAGYTGNAGKARVKGVEYDADLRLGKLTLSTSGAYNDAALKGNFCNFVAQGAAISQLATCTLGQNVAGTNTNTPQVAAAGGTRLPRQPKFKGTTSLRYNTDVGDYTAYLQGAALYQGGATQDLNVKNNNLLTCPGVTSTKACATKGFVSFDFSGGFKKDNWTLDFFLQNAFDKRGTLTKNTFCSIDFCAGSARTFAIKPQFMGVRFGQKF
jgi:outer membrane receptor protein involved in Fe transport